MREEVLKLAKEMMEKDPSLTEWISTKFPELKESEDEKRIRRCIKDLIKENTFSNIYGVTKEQCLTWIEKQGEQNLADKVEPKFKVGDKIKTLNEESLIITKIDEKGYWSENLFICDFDEECLWDLVEQNLTWCEEDDKKAERIIRLLQEGYDENCIKSSIDWLVNRSKSLKPQSTWKPSDER